MGYKQESIVAESGDAHFYNVQGNWTTARSEGSAPITASGSTLSVLAASYTNVTQKYEVDRALLQFDLSSLSTTYAEMAVGSVKLNMRMQAVPQDFYMAYYISSATMPFAEDDFDSYSTYIGSDFIEAATEEYEVTLAITTEVYNAVNGDGVLTILLREKSHDYDDIAPDLDEYSGATIYSAESEGFTKPTLSIYFQLPSTQSECSAGGWYWYGSECNAELPASSSLCNTYGYYWYGDACHLLLPDTKTDCLNNFFYWYGGTCRYINVLAVVSCKLIDSFNNLWLVAGHEVESIEEVFVTPKNTGIEPQYIRTGYTAHESYAHADGLNGKIAVIEFTGDTPPDPEDRVWCNVIGMKSLGAEANPIDVMTNFMQVYLGFNHDDYSNALFSEAKQVAADRGYRVAGMILSGDSPREILQQMAYSVGAALFKTIDGKLGIKFLK